MSVGGAAAAEAEAEAEVSCNNTADANASNELVPSHQLQRPQHPGHPPDQAQAPKAAPTTTADLDLGFSDVSSPHLFQLQAPFGVVNNNNIANTDNNPTTTGSPASAVHNNSTISRLASESGSPIANKTIQPRKPSPGLTARLKALGLATHKKSADPLPNQQDNIGRLPEDQIRQLDENHKTNSGDSIIHRRGRPWKGILHHKFSEASNTSTNASIERPGTEAPSSTTDVALGASLVLPEIITTEPLDMETHKYRLPDHTNGNGTKVQLETRREHLERSASQTSTDQPPPPPPKDTPPVPQAEFTPDLASYLNPSHQRPGSIYTLSRASFANQLAQLTSLQLPDAESLSSKVSAIPTAQIASKALINAAEQIRSWIYKASEVIGGLDSDDDVEWAAAGGREGLEEVENAIYRFEELIKVYVSAIEELQCREDIADVPPTDLHRAVSQMESIIEEWANIKATLNTVKGQVEIAMEWEELWNLVLGDIQTEMDELSRLVFEMEERRHKSLMAAATGDGVDIGDLENIVEDTPPPVSKTQAQTRFSLTGLALSPGSTSPSTPTLSQDDSSLLALFARMQPLRASLDFLPMRLAVFAARAEKSFPTACEELEMRRAGLDGSYKKLEKDAESLRKELGEDRWVLVFRGAGRQAQKMIESVERSMKKLREGVDTGVHLSSPPTMSKKIESYDAKKTHYGPAIERVLAIIDKGVKDRLTVNGEILRLHAEMQSKWESIKDEMREMDVVVDEVQADNRGQQLRDSISSMLSNDRSTIGSGRETPGSSPPSSVIMSSLGFEPMTPTPKMAKNRSASSGHLPQPSGRRQSSLPTPSQVTRKPLTSRLSSMTSRLGTPSAASIPRPHSTLPNRPRWNSSTNTTDVGIGHNFKPLSLTSPSPYAKSTSPVVRPPSSLTPRSSSPGGSRLPTIRGPFNRDSSASPMPEDTPTKRPPSKLSFRERLASPGPYSQQMLSKPRLSSSVSTSGLESQSSRRASLQPPRSHLTADDRRPSRPASSLASTRRTSLLPQPKAPSATTGRETPSFGMTPRSATRKTLPELSKSTSAASSKPRWRA
ncbi:karyogamy protein [Colletotrichum truncatum]|uniref:Karyogamy protein n=1 Tax=Colletotrichum truncatum TaxID=5467 RepID=A0ACC3Z494_COLTU|nr:karyogamy protein [Colletotrichum truncatum]KAF6795773.1 karyogamy protein [Colletotrichum truncatum]